MCDRFGAPRGRISVAVLIAVLNEVRTGGEIRMPWKYHAGSLNPHAGSTPERRNSVGWAHSLQLRHALVVLLVEIILRGTVILHL